MSYLPEHSDLKDLTSDDHPQYLPLTAGSGKPLTGDLYVDKSDASVLLRYSGSTVYTEFKDASHVSYWNAVSDGGKLIYINPLPAASSAAEVGLFRTTNTSGGRLLNLYLGDNSTTVQHTFNAGTGDVDLCQQGGELTIGGTGGTQKLNVVAGHIGVDNGYTYRGKNTAGSYIELLSVENGAYRALIGATGARTKLRSNDSVLYPVPTSAVSDANHDASYMTFWVDETAHTLNFKVKYSNGTTVKSGSVALS